MEFHMDLLFGDEAAQHFRLKMIGRVLESRNSVVFEPASPPFDPSPPPLLNHPHAIINGSRMVINQLFAATTGRAISYNSASKAH